MLHRISARAFLIVGAGLLSSLVMAGHAAADEKGREEMEKVLKAYRDTNQYQSQATVEVKTEMGRIKSIETGDYFLNFSRADKQVMVDRPDVYMTIDGGKMSLKSDQIPGRFAKLDAPAQLSFESITKTASHLRTGVQPDLIFLTAQMPTIHIAGRLLEPDNFNAVAPRADDPAKRPGLQAKVGNETLTLWYDPTSFMITQVTREMPGVPDAKSTTTLNFNIQVKSLNKELPKDAFAFDAKGLTEAPSIEEWITGPAQVKQANNAPTDQAPEIDLKTLDGKNYKLSKDPNPVVVLDFWATWCPPCVAGLPKIQEVYEWSGSKGYKVSFYPINLEEEPDEIKAFWTKHKLTMPVLLDSNGKTAQAYGAFKIPRTVITVNGKIFRVWEGLSPNMDRELKAGIEEALKRAEREAKEKETQAPKA